VSYVFTDDVVMSVQKSPIFDGVTIATALLGIGKTFLLSELSMDEMTRWSKLHKVVFDELRCGVTDTKKAILSLFSMGKVDTLFTTNPALAEWAFERGITVSLVCFPRYSVPKNRPGLKPWNTLVDEIERQALDVQDLEEEL
jgi:hypothetical protein